MYNKFSNKLRQTPKLRGTAIKSDKTANRLLFLERANQVYYALYYLQRYEQYR